MEHSNVGGDIIILLHEDGHLICGCGTFLEYIDGNGEEFIDMESHDTPLTMWGYRCECQLIMPHNINEFELFRWNDSDRGKKC